MANERYPLHQVMLDDLTSHNKVALLLLVLVVASAIATVWVTHQTRLLMSEHAMLSKDNQALQNQFIHLQLEENSQSQKSRVEAVAEKLELQKVKKEQEVILMR